MPVRLQHALTLLRLSQTEHCLHHGMAQKLLEVFTKSNTFDFLKAIPYEKPVLRAVTSGSE